MEIRKGAFRSGFEESSQTLSVGLRHCLPNGSDESPDARHGAPQGKLGVSDLVLAWTEGSKSFVNLLI